MSRQQFAFATILSYVLMLAPLARAEAQPDEAGTRIARSTSFLIASAPGSAWFQQKLSQYAKPDVCTMVLCNGACCGRADACGPFSGMLILDPDSLGNLVTEHNCAALLSRNNAPPAVSVTTSAESTCCGASATSCGGIKP